MSNAYTHEPDPKPGQANVADYVLADIQARVEAGEKKYGTKLQTHNGRDALIDAYQEALDLVMYLRQAILERDTQAEPPAPRPYRRALDAAMSKHFRSDEA